MHFVGLPRSQKQGRRCRQTNPLCATDSPDDCRHFDVFHVTIEFPRIMGTEIFKKIYPQKTQKTFSCRRKIHPTPGTLSNQLSVTWETRRENWNLPGPVNYATQNGRPCPRTGIFFCKATSAEDRNLQPPKALNKDRAPPKHALARAVEYTASGSPQPVPVYGPKRGPSRIFSTDHILI